GRHHRGRALQDLRLRLGDRLLVAGHRMGEGQEAVRGGGHQEHPDRGRAVAAAGEDPLLDPGRGRDQGRGRGLQEETQVIMAVTLTEKAATHVQNYLAKRGRGVALRLGVRTTGCSGMAYKLEYADAVNPDDVQVESHGDKGAIDPKSLPSL